MHMRSVVCWAATALAGATVAVVGLMTSYWWDRRATATSADFGWYHYSPPRRYADYLPSTAPTNWAALLIPAAIVGAVIGLLLAYLVRLAYLRITAGSEKS